MGHEEGLHFDANQYDISSAEALEIAQIKEKNVLETIIGVGMNSFLFHNPSSENLQFRSCYYGGMVNAYNSELMERFEYCSDSNEYWRFTPLGEFLDQNHPNVCVLTHPVWWQNEVMSPRSRIIRSIEGRAEATLKRYDALLDFAGRENIST